MKLKRTLTSIFFVPTLGNRDAFNNNGFLNGYCADASRESSYEDCVYLLFKPKNIDKFKDFLDNEYIRTKQIVEDYDYEDGFIVVVYQLDPRFKKDYELIKKGKYSQTSQEFQELFPKTLKVSKKDKETGLYKYVEEVSLQYRIFNKTIDLKEYWEAKIGTSFNENMEMWDIWEDDKEVLNINEVKELV